MRNHVMMAALGAAFLCAVGCGGGDDDDDGGPPPGSCLAPFTSYAGDGNLMGCAGLSVDSTPDGAMVALDGRVLSGTTSAAADWLVPEGPYTVEVTLAGYETFTQEVYAIGFVTRVNATLVPTTSAMGVLDVSADVGGGTVVVDGVDHGVMDSMPMGIDLPEGTHRVTVRDVAGYVASWDEVMIRRGETASVMLSVGRDISGRWTCMAGLREVMMDPTTARNTVFAIGLDSFVYLLVNGDRLSSMEGGTITGSINADGQSLEYTFTGPGGTVTERCMR